MTIFDKCQKNYWTDFRIRLNVSWVIPRYEAIYCNGIVLTYFGFFFNNRLYRISAD